jgi:RNA polymerase sigma-70 factor (ECF subfamily)
MPTLVGIKDISANDLARLCAAQSGAVEWGEFVRRFSKPISLSVLRVGRMWGETSPEILDDIVQDVFLKFCEDGRRILHDFEPRHPDSFVAFVKVVSAAAANDYFRKRNTSKRGGGIKEEAISELHAEVVQDPEWLERNYLLKEIDNFLAVSGHDEIGRRDRTVFWLYYQQGMTASAIAGLPGMSLSVKGVESALHRMTSQIRCHLRRPLVTPVVKKFSSSEGFAPHSTVQRGEWT